MKASGRTKKAAAKKTVSKTSRPVAVKATPPAKRKAPVKKKVQVKKTTSPSPVKTSSVSNIPFWNIRDAGDAFKVRVCVPGLSKKDIQVNVVSNLLTISGVKEKNTEQEGKHYVVREYHYDSWSRSIALPAKVNASDIKVRYKDGILKLDLPKA